MTKTSKLLFHVAAALSLTSSAAFTASSLHAVHNNRHSLLSTTTQLYSSTSLPPSSSHRRKVTRAQTEPVPSPNALSRAERQRMPDVMLEPSYFLTIAVALLCPLIIWYHPSYAQDGSPSIIGILGGGFHLLFATLLWVQTRRVRCVFEKDAFEFYNIKGPHLDLNRGAWLEEKPANYVAGTPNRWKYDTIINYGFFPSIHFPVICYFKETETPEWKWDRWFAAFDAYGNGQPHFFPGICDVYEFRRQMELRGVKSKVFKK